MAAALSQSDIQRYKDDGFVVVRGVFDAAAVADLRAASDELLRQARDIADDAFRGVTYFNIHRNADPFAKNIADVPPVKGMLRRVTYPYAASPVFDRYRTHPGLIAAVGSLLGDDIVQIVNQVNFNPPGIGVGWGWHQDYRFRKPGIEDMLNNFVQCILAIDLCSPFTGGVRFIPRSDRLGGLKLDTDVENAESHFDAATAVTPEMQPGDAVLFNPYVIHGSTANKSPHSRRVYINGYARAQASAIGMPVRRAGRIVAAVEGVMEYERDQAKLPLASKY
jgi:ectoine hydroxylase-related dioxygenase (phytanoyl-CoA dioxygenase family)